MPAIHLSQLKTQSARLSEKFFEPDLFVQFLGEMLDIYTNRTVRASRVVRQFALPSYRTPLPVLRQILAELVPLAGDHPDGAIKLIDVLWKAGFLESRMLAAKMLGSLPPSHAMSALAGLPALLSQSIDVEIRTALLTDALSRLRQENPVEFFNLLEGWLKSPLNSVQSWGLQALIPMLTDPNFENLPVVFRILKPALLTAGPVTQMDLQTCLIALGKFSQVETLSYLREIISENPVPLMMRTFRRILKGLPVEMQPGMQRILREYGKRQ